MHTIWSYRGNRPTNTHPQTGPITIHCAAAIAQCNERLEQEKKQHTNDSVRITSTDITLLLLLLLSCAKSHMLLCDCYLHAELNGSG